MVERMMLSWLPLIGPILQGLGNVVSAFTSVDIAKINRDVAEVNASVEVIKTTNDDICIRILRDMACLPVVVWSMLIGWDTIVSKHWPTVMFHVPNYPPSVSYLPYAVLIFLLGNIGINAWKNK